MIIDPSQDGHVHTALCHHAVGEMEEYVVAAINKGLKEIIFLEHMEEGINTYKTTWLTENEFDAYFTAGRRLQHKFQDKIRIGLGVEVGYNPLFKERLSERLAARKWDRIGVSSHFYTTSEHENHLNLVSRNDLRIQALSERERKEIEKSYYLNLIEAVTFLPGDVICHLDAVLRHHPSQKTASLPWDLITHLLDRIKKKNMAIEINTSGIAMRGEVFPRKEIIALAMKKDIPLVAGSDAHKPGDVGNHFSLLEELLTK